MDISNARKKSAFSRALIQQPEIWWFTETAIMRFSLRREIKTERTAKHLHALHRTEK